LVLEPTPSAVPPADDADWNDILASVGEAQQLLNRVGPAGLVPRPDLCSSERCLVGGTPGAAELLVYVPGGGEVAIDLSAVPDAFATSWLDFATGKEVPGGDVAGGQVVRLVAPAGDDTVLHLRQRQTTNLFLPSVLR
jgi:hypothetical protein